ncbi:MAG: hypothetical protein OEZ57_00735 [Nitrospirota bacterium]|nr:hypothetical protein [Nitrospira sp.]MCA9479865.1 hypothetical protein [Nitrospira sp.]MDH5457087.1 hypothetical protein [Nitrospinota bacterium]MDH5585178.1 hypothetical protein [Nitrospirota bacterium]MDH5773423.1 hypothetical protein [Nitrospirota bacterium]
MLNTENSTKKGAAPSLYAYYVTKKEGQDKTFWTRTGAAWVHKDKKGFNLRLDNGREVVLRIPKPK